MRTIRVPAVALPSARICLLVAALFAIAGCGPSVSDCARCRPGEVCYVGYRYCNETTPMTVMCRARPVECTADEDACASTACGAAVRHAMIAPVFKACVDAGVPTVSACD